MLLQKTLIIWALMQQCEEKLKVTPNFQYSSQPSYHWTITESEVKLTPSVHVVFTSGGAHFTSLTFGLLLHVLLFYIFIEKGILIIICILFTFTRTVVCKKYLTDIFNIYSKQNFFNHI